MNKIIASAIVVVCVALSYLFFGEDVATPEVPVTPSVPSVVKSFHF